MAESARDRVNHLAAGVAVMVLGWAGCLIDIDYRGTRYRCVEEPRCPTGFVCVEGYCESAPDAAVASLDVTAASGAADRTADAPVRVDGEPAEPLSVEATCSDVGERSLVYRQSDL